MFYNLVNDFAHIPWEDTPNFPTPPQSKEILHKLLVKHPGYLPGVCGWDLRFRGWFNGCITPLFLRLRKSYVWSWYAWRWVIFLDRKAQMKGGYLVAIWVIYPVAVTCWWWFPRVHQDTANKNDRWTTRISGFDGFSRMGFVLKT